VPELRLRAVIKWGGRGSNPRPTDYESVTVAFVDSSCVGCSTMNRPGESGDFLM
jgi:hypothetical protein